MSAEIDWSEQQLRALEHVTKWFEGSSEQYYLLAGYAGTGKTTIARELGKRLGGQGQGTGILFAAYTGKAAHVLMKAGVPKAFTIHSLIYQPRDKCGKKLAELKAERLKLLKEDPFPEERLSKLEDAIRKENANMQRPDFTLNTDSVVSRVRLVVIDEYSMVDETMGRDLLSFGCRVLALGDPGQLPPVQSRCFFTGKPDTLLTEIHRHAEGNPIIKLSKDVRDGKAIKPGAYGKSRMMYRASLPPGEENDILLGADQVLVGKNVTRRKLNKTIRELLGFKSALPQPGDKLVCLRNNHDEGFLNGQTWYVVEAKEYGKGKHYLELKLRDDDGVKRKCIAHRFYFDGNPEDIDRSGRATNEFDYGYALTVHKAQGSQWNNVILIDEWTFNDREKWLYTGITRAVESVTILR
jgi:exodeoxyribonuclease-5